jgi:hypothetical protein
VPDAIGRLRTHEENQKGKKEAKDSGEKLLYTHAELEARVAKERKKFQSSSSKKPDGRGSGKERGQDRPQGSGRGKGDRFIDERRPREYDITEVKCFNCNKKGHFAKDCKEPDRRVKANLAKRGDDEEEHMLLAESCVLTLDNPCLNRSRVFLHERKVIPKLKGNQNTRWYLDTGASNHMTGCREKFTELDRGVTGSVKFGDGSIVEICGKGSVLFECQNGEHRILTEVYYIPRLKSNIVSIGQLDEYGCKTLVVDGFMTLWDRSRKVLAKVKRSSNRLYILNINESKPECWVAKSREDAWLWHARYGHVNFHALKNLADKEMVLGMPHIDQIERVCDGCLVGKQHRASFPAVSSFRAATPLEILHGDLCGPITPATNAGKKYFLLIVDDFSRFMWIVLIRSKDEAFEAFCKMKAATEMELKLQVRSLRTDRGGEFTSREFNDYCEEKGIKRLLLLLIHRSRTE